MDLLLSPEIYVKTITSEQLFDSYQFVTVRSYCQNCNCHDKNYSCPPFAPSGEKYIVGDNDIALLLTLLDTAPLNHNFEMIATREYPSETRDDYNKHGKELSPYTAISMYAFDDMKAKVQKKLFALEKKFGFISLPPGKCSLCSTCQRILGNACARPNELRFSLESLGFLVSDLMLRHFDYQITWTENSFSPHFTTLSAMVLSEKLPVEKIKKEFEQITIKF